jgi:hypothetical protein
MSHSQRLVLAGLVLLLGCIGIYFNLQSRAASLPELPVSVGFRHALIGKSLVAEFTSHAPKNMAVIVDVVDAASHDHRSYRVNVGPGRPTPFGHREGYSFEPGDTLTMMHDGFKPIVAQVPSM